MGRYISFAKFHKKHLYILFSLICLILKDFAFGYKYNNSFISSSQDQDKNNPSNHFLINNILSYTFTIILSFILYKIERKNLGRNSLKEKENEDNSSLPTIKYIYNDTNKAYLSNNSLSFFLIIILLWILYENLFKFFWFLKELDFWMVEIIIISYMMSKMFKEKIYLHHKVVICLNFTLPLLKLITIILSFNDECNKGENYQYCNNTNNNNNNNINNTINSSYTINNFIMYLSRNETLSLNENEAGNNSTGLTNLYVVRSFLVPIVIIISIILMSIRSYVNLSIKSFMDLKYISEKKLLILYGLMGSIISFIICIITTIFKCKDEGNEKDIYDYICKVKSNITNTNNTYITLLYFDSFTVFFQSGSWIKILRSFLGSIFFCFNRYFSMLIIKNFTPVHLIFTFPVYYFFQKIILIIINAIMQDKAFEKNNFIVVKLILDFWEDILSSIGFLIYLEIIELNFCKLNYNLKRKISDRADEENYSNLGIEDENEMKIKNGTMN